MTLGNRKLWQYEKDRTSKGPRSCRAKDLTQVIRLRIHPTNVLSEDRENMDWGLEESHCVNNLDLVTSYRSRDCNIFAL